MKKKKYFIIYKTTNLKNGKFYIGAHVTVNLNDSYLGSGKVLRNSVFYHGRENFIREILEFCENDKILFEREAEIVNDELLKDPKCMNLVVGGHGGFGFVNNEHRENFFNAAKKNSKERSKKACEKFLELIKDDKWRANQIEKMKKGSHLYFSNNDGNFKNKKHSELSKQKISEANKISLAGTGNSQYGTCWITNDVLNKKILKTDNLPDDWHYGRVIKK